MANVLLVIHLMIATAMIVFVLMQRSEGGGLGMGGGSGFMTGRGTTNFLTRITGMLAAAFFVSTLILALLAQYTPTDRSLFDAKKPLSIPAVQTPATTDPKAPATTTTTPAPATTPAPVAPVAPPAPPVKPMSPQSQ